MVGVRICDPGTGGEPPDQPGQLCVHLVNDGLTVVISTLLVESTEEIGKQLGVFRMFPVMHTQIGEEYHRGFLGVNVLVDLTKKILYRGVVRDLDVLVVFTGVAEIVFHLDFQRLVGEKNECHQTGPYLQADELGFTKAGGGLNHGEETPGGGEGLDRADTLSLHEIALFIRGLVTFWVNLDGSDLVTAGTGWHGSGGGGRFRWG